MSVVVRRSLVFTAVAAVSLCAIAPAHAQPAPASGTPDKADAKALMQSGLKLLEAKDYLGALAVFKEAYARFASPKILLNIGTTYKLLNRQADAANTYQRYLETKDADAKRRGDITKLLAEIDRTVGVVDLAVTPPTAEVRVGADDWVAADTLARVRVPVGTTHVEARHAGFTPATTSVTVAAGAHAQLAIDLVPLPDPVAAVDDNPHATTTTGADDGLAVNAHATPGGPRSRFGLIAIGHVDVPHGWSPLFGVTADIVSHVQVDAAAIIGSFYGGYLGARYTFLDAAYRPYLSAGAPVFHSNGLRYSVRGAGGLEWRLNRHLAALVEVGVERELNAEAGKLKTLFVPALGISGRL